MSLRSFAVIICLFLSATPSFAENLLKKLACGERSTNIDVTTRHGDPEILLGPETLTFSRLNRLRYDISLEGSTSFTDGPDLAGAGFIPSLPRLPEAPEEVPEEGAGEGGGPEAAPAGEAPLEEAMNEAGNIRSRLGTLLDQAQTSSNSLQSTLDDLARLVDQSDSLIATDAGAKVLFDDIQEMAVRIKDDLAKWKWPSQTEIASLRADIEKTRETLKDMEEDVAQEGTSAYRNYSRTTIDLQHMSEALGALEATGEQRKSYDALVANLKMWRSVLDGIGGVDDFQQTVPVRCGHPFFKNKTVTFEITRRDRTIADETKAVTKETIATVECPSVASVTGGVGISGLDDREIKLVSSPGANESDPAVNTFGYGDKGSEQVNPMMLISTRLTDCTQYNWHITAGTVFDIDNPASSVALGYLLGATVSFRDNLFLTGGLQFGRVYALGGGFEIGDKAPTGVAAPPLEREWDQAWVLAASFKIN